MYNLVGTGLNQLPTNSMLGGMAYQSPDHASIKDLDLKNLSQINSEIADTAVDIFVYDTRKDSDGGAWRKRTQHTSWYNETLNTAARGARREFPAVAVIVAESDTLTIYDGDDPDLPMWMVFPSDGYLTWASNGTPALTSVHMLNGILVTGGSAGRSGIYSDFTKDDTRYIYSSAYYNPGDRTIAGRTVTVSAVSGDSYVAGGDGFAIANNSINDVAMTVLPNAPIDPSTGLPIPTIAVANDGGVSVIKDDGSVVDWTETSGPDSTHKLSFRKDGKLGVFTSGTAGAGGYPQLYYIDIPSTDISSTYYYTFASNNFEMYGGTAWETNTAGNLVMRNAVGSNPLTQNLTDVVDAPNLTYAATNAGLNAIIKPEVFGTPNAGEADMRTGAIAYIQNDYNTGYMFGDIKGAFLSDTDTTNTSELVTNGTFDSNTTGWTAVDATITHSSGTAVVNRTGGAGLSAYQAITTVIGETYVLTGTIDSTGTGNRGDIRIYSNLGSTMLVNASGTDNQTVTVSATFTATTTTSYVYFTVDGIGTATFDNVSVRLAEEDRSVNNNPLQVFGTINKSAVETGADLVGYSGYSSSNYLVQPNIAAPGTGDFSITVWIKPNTLDVGTGNYVHVFSLGTSSTGGQGRSTGFVFKLTTHTGANANGYSPYLFSSDGGSNQGTYSTSNYIPLGKWSQVIMMRRSGVAYVYANGELMQTGNSWTTNLTDTYLTIFKGIGYNEYGGDAEFALLRYSLSAPSAEQIKKIYEDEKVLFQENAKCTLYGTSDAVTALAYDDSASLLHVGTSSGRSEFKGLRRVGNTTTAVTTAISASSGLVAEQ